MARTANPNKIVTVPVQASLTPAEREAIEAYGWSPDVRLKPAQFVTQAVKNEIARLGLDVSAAQVRLDERAEAEKVAKAEAEEAEKVAKAAKA